MVGRLKRPDWLQEAASNLSNPVAVCKVIVFEEGGF